MKSYYDRPLTPHEADKRAQKLRKALYINHTNYLCTALNLCPDKRQVAPYLHKGFCKNDYEATMRWLREYLGEADILQYPTDLNELLSAFNRALHNKVPTAYWGEDS